MRKLLMLIVLFSILLAIPTEKSVISKTHEGFSYINEKTIVNFKVESLKSPLSGYTVETNGNTYWLSFFGNDKNAKFTITSKEKLEWVDKYTFRIFLHETNYQFGTNYKYYTVFSFKDLKEKNPGSTVSLSKDFILTALNISDWDPTFYTDTTADWDLGTHSNTEATGNNLISSRDAVLILNFDTENDYDQSEYIKDWSAYGNNGETTTPSLCTSNDCFDFDGTNDYIYIADDGRVGDWAWENKNWSVGVWLNPGTATHNEYFFGRSSASKGMSLRLATNDRIYATWGNGTDNFQTHTAIVFSDTNYFVVAAYNENTNNLSIYLDGVFQDSVIGGYVDNTDKVVIGRENSLGANVAYDGQIYSTVAYNKTLSLTEIVSLNSSGKGYVNTSDPLLLVGYVMNSTTYNKTLTDLSGNNNHGDLGVWYNNGVNGGAVETGGHSKASVNIDYFDELNVSESGEFTVMTWVKSTSGITWTGVVVAGKSGLGVSKGYGIVYDGNQFAGKITGDTEVTSITPVIQEDVWYHVTFTKKGVNQYLYLNGSLVDTDLAPTGDFTPPSTSGVGIGDYPDFYGSVFTGSIDDARILSRSLSVEEILEYYNGSKSSYSDEGYMPIYLDDGIYTSRVFDGSYGGEWINSTTSGLFDNDTIMDFDVSDSGLVLAWNMSDTSFTDLSGNGNDGTPTGTSLINATFGNEGSTYFDGVDDKIVVSSDSSLNLSAEGSWGGWIKHSDDSLNIVFMKGLTAYIDWDYGVSTRAGNVYCTMGNSSYHLEVGATMPKNEWHHAMCINDGTNLILYVDGEQKDTEPLIPNIRSSTNNLEFGGYQTYYHLGYIRNVKIYNRSLSATEIKEQYRESSGAYLNISARTSYDNSSWSDWTDYNEPLLTNGFTDINAYGRYIQYRLSTNNNQFFSIAIGNESLEYSQDTCHCPSPVANWELDMSENCELNSVCDITGYDLSLFNQGNFTVDNTLTLNEILNLSNGMNIWVKPNGLIWNGAS